MKKAQYFRFVSCVISVILCCLVGFAFVDHKAAADEKNILEDGTYTMQSFLRSASSDQASMGNAGIVQPIQLIVKNGTYTVRAECKALSTKLGKINFTVGVSLTYLSETEQIWVKDCIVSGASSVTGSMATKLKQYSDEGNLTELAVQLILNEKKTETGKVTLTEKKIRKYFPKEYNREQIEQVIYELLDNWKKSQ